MSWGHNAPEYTETEGYSRLQEIAVGPDHHDQRRSVREHTAPFYILFVQVRLMELADAAGHLLNEDAWAPPGVPPS